MSQNFGDGVKEQDDDFVALSASLERARRAMELLTKNDVAELRRLSHPPEAIKTIFKALMILLTGEQSDWKTQVLGIELLVSPSL